MAANAKSAVNQRKKVGRKLGYSDSLLVKFTGGCWLGAVEDSSKRDDSPLCSSLRVRRTRSKARQTNC